MVNFCEICKKPATQSCSACNQVYYCCKDHQRTDWKNHKKSCTPFKVLTNATIGRYVVASRDIKQGEVIIKKLPLILGPKMVSSLLCLGCHQRLQFDRERYNCSRCKWPLCGKICENAEWHHQYECGVFEKHNFEPNFIDNNSKQTIYSCIVPLRCLILKQRDPKKFEALLSCQSHLELHRNTQIYQILRKTLVPLLVDKLQLATDEQEILNICSILDTNTFEVRDTKGLVLIRGLYPTISLLSHSCKHNTKHCFISNAFELVLTATVPISKDEPITTTYTQTLWGTLNRRAHLKQSKLFDCNCQRCSDPTEFGLYVGSINCNQCFNHQNETQPKMISLDPLDAQADWKCQNCEHRISAKQIVWGNDALRSEILTINKNKPEDFEEFLIKYPEILHPTNWHCLEVKYALSQIYGNLTGYLLEELSPQLLQRKIDLCHELLDVADILEPGYSRFRGLLLYDLQAAMVMKAKIDLADEKITKQEAEAILSSSVEHLNEAAKILATEPDMKDVLEERLENLQKLLQLKIDVCYELLDVADVLEPDYSRFRGLLLYDLQAAMAMKAKIDLADEKITKQEAEAILRSSVEHLNEAAKVLATEPDMKDLLEERLANLQKVLTL